MFECNESRENRADFILVSHHCTKQTQSGVVIPCFEEKSNEKIRKFSTDSKLV